MLKLWLSLALTGLQSAVKNPKSLAKEAGILIQIRDTINAILVGIGTSGDTPNFPSTR